MKVIALLPVRNEAWVLPHSLACLSGFCDVVLVSDQRSSDDSREICRRFPNVVVLDSAEDLVCEQARWRLWDAARNYDGRNLIWCTDADELVSPKLANRFLTGWRDRLAPGTAIECLFYHLWERATEYRDDESPYRPYWKPLGIVDDRRMDYDRSRALPLHEHRVPVACASLSVRAEELPVLHLQWLIADRNQMKQAWYRCREWLDGHKPAATINQDYSITLPAARTRTAPVPREWVEDVTFPQLSAETEPSWQEREILGWFHERGAQFFEPLEIWHIPALGREFSRRVGRQPKPDRSYRPAWPARARRFATRAARAARRRMPF